MLLLNVKNIFLANLNELETRKKSTTKLTKNSKLYKAVIEALQGIKGENIVTLDLRNVNESVADFFVVCSASSTTQVKALADNVDKIVAEKCNERPYKQEGYTALQWVLIDYVNIVVHIMHPSAREFYKLEEMWSDAIPTLHD